MIDHVEYPPISGKGVQSRQRLEVEFRFKLIENEGISPGRAGETTPEEPIYKCCGKYPNRMPFQFRSSEGEERRCCEGKFLHFLINFLNFQTYKDPGHLQLELKTPSLHVNKFGARDAHLQMSWGPTLTVQLIGTKAGDKFRNLSYSLKESERYICPLQILCFTEYPFSPFQTIFAMKAYGIRLTANKFLTLSWTFIICSISTQLIIS